MSEPILGESFRTELKELVREVIREELAEASNGSGQLTRHHEDDGLVNSGKAAEYLAVSRSWLYKNSDRLPFARKVGGALRFDRHEMRRWIEGHRR